MDEGVIPMNPAEGGSRRSPVADEDGGGNSSESRDIGGRSGTATAQREHQQHASPSSPLLSQITIGTKLEVYWRIDNAYYPGTVSAHVPNDWQAHVYTINYDDGEFETIDMATERFRILSGGRKRGPIDDDNRDGNGDRRAVENGDVKEREIRSLVVSFGERAETWHSPPSHDDDDDAGDDFVWPEGWIEVRRPAETSGKHCVREFHPPCQKGRRTKVCRSMEEAVNYITRQREKRLKQERLEARANDPSNRKSGRERRSISDINHNRQQLQLYQKLSVSNNNNKCTDPRNSILMEGTQTELNKLMKGSNRRLAQKMVDSILYGAVLARKKDLLETGPGFLGANGRMYPDLRKAFGKHTDIKQCSLCKSRVQGHWYCRIRHGHLDKPDFDGGDSAARLRELFRYTVEELEAMLESLLPGNKKRAAITNTASNEGFGDGGNGKEWSMNVLSEDLLYQIAAFLPSLSQLSSFCKASKRGQQLLHGSVHTEKLLRGTFLRTFGERATKGNFERDLTWRERWGMIRDLRRGLVQKSIISPSAVSRRLKETVGVMLPHEEREAVYYDNREHDTDPESARCTGYFGMEVLHLPRPPNALEDWQPPLCVRGDFNGIRIFDLDSLFQTNSTDDIGDGNVNGNGERSTNDGINSSSVTIGDDEGGGQVLSLIHCDVPRASHNGPCCFIGYASGRVAAVSATLNANKDGYDFAISGTHHAHESEVTDLAFMDCRKSSSCDDDDDDGDEQLPILFSACCAGKVYFYPHATDPSRNYSLQKSVLAFTNFYDCPIFSLASTVISCLNNDHGKSQSSCSVLCTGDRDGNIRLWLKLDDDLDGLCTSTDKFRHVQLYKSSTHRGTGFHLVTRAMFIKDDLLLTGTNNGDVRFWQLRCNTNYSELNYNILSEKRMLPTLTLRYDLMGIHNGAVEYLTNVGDVLLSSGGNDGKIVGWDINTGLRLGSVQCHLGRWMETDGGGNDNNNVFCKSCVVDLLISGKDGSMISLCRDGSLRQLNIMV